mmetsp:Transcript_28858/g.84244  ORF Transcript_28858/g.84244 Transcript_28858/m.84244 type:complete len:855 (-) Transcript_28858:321-2885(-)
MTSMMGKKGFQRRYFVLQGTTLKYFREIDSTAAAGSIDLMELNSVEESIVPDAPAYALDLRAKDRLYTVAAETETDMLRWALAVTQAIGAQGEQVRDEATEIQWQRFDVVFEVKEPLLLNVKGVANRNEEHQITNHWIVVTGFAKNEFGNPGPAERGGLITPMDIIIGCNGVDLTELNFNECMAVIRQAEWPKTLHFIRDPAGADATLSIKEGWARFGQAGAGQQRRRRYLDLKPKELQYSKPTPGGAICGSPDGSIALDSITSLALFEDRAAPLDEAFQLHIGLVDAGATIVLAVASKSEVLTWASAIDSVSDLQLFTDQPIIVLDPQDMEALASKAGDLLLFDEIKGAFLPQRFILLPEGVETAVASGPCLVFGQRSLSLGSSSRGVSAAASLRFLHASACKDASYQLVVGTRNGDVVIAANEQAEAKEWVEEIHSVLADGSQDITLPELEEAPTWNPLKGTGAETEETEEALKFAAIDLNPQELDCDHFGWLHKRGELKAGLLGSTRYRPRFFVLKEGRLHYFKTAAAAANGEAPTGTINLHEVVQVRGSQDPATPEFAIDLLTQSRIIVIVAENDGSFTKWLAVLHEALDHFSEQDLMRRAVLPRPSEASSRPSESFSRPSLSGSRQRDHAAASIVKGGLLMKRTENRITGSTTWKKRFFALSAPQLAYYEQETDLFSEDGEPLGAIPLHQISRLGTATDAKVAPGCGVEIVAKQGNVQGARQDGNRHYLLEAATPTEAKAWMEAICETSGRLKLSPGDDGSLQSIIVEGIDARRLAQVDAQQNVYRAAGFRTDAGGRGRGRSGRLGGRGGRGASAVGGGALPTTTEQAEHPTGSAEDGASTMAGAQDEN